MEALTTNTTIKACFGLALAVLVSVAVFVIAGARRSQETVKWVEHTREVKDQLNAALYAVVTAESASRGFLVTGDSTFLQTFEPSLKEARQHLDTARTLTRDNFSQQERLDRLVPLFERKTRVLYDLLAAHQARGPEAGVEVLASGEGRQTMDGMRALVEEMDAEENRLLGERSRAAAAMAAAHDGITIAAAVLAFAIVAFAGWFVLRDASARHAAVKRIRGLNEELEHRAALLEASNKELESFSYSVSHDLRAPLRHIDGFADMLAKRLGDSVDPTSQRYVRTISESARRMGTLIDDLLVFSRMGRTEIRQTAVPLGAVVDDALAELRAETQGRRIEWRRGPLPEVQADPTLVRLVLTNLLSNAIKYTRPRDPAKIEIGSLDKGNGEAVVYVRDNGVGFDMTYAKKLFGVFQRLHRSDEFEGTGIGLANVRRIIGRHGGRTWAEGRLNEGATFYFSLPKTTMPNATS